MSKKHLSRGLVPALLLVMIAFPAAAESTPESGHGSSTSKEVVTQGGEASLSSLDPAMRLQAARTLGTTGSAEAIPELTRVLRSDPDVEVRAECVEALYRIATPEAREAISNAALNDRSERIRQLVALRCPECVPAPQQTEPPTPFEATTPEASTTPPPSSVPASPTLAVAPAPQPTPMPAPAPVQPHRRVRGVTTLASGIALLVVSSVPFSVGSISSSDWDACEWEGDTMSCGRTGYFAGSMFLFSLGGTLALAGLILIPIGAARVAASSRESADRSWIGSLSPFASPLSRGGAIFGISGRLR